MKPELDLHPGEGEALHDHLLVAISNHEHVAWPDLGVFERLERQTPGALDITFQVLHFQPAPFLVQALGLPPWPPVKAETRWVTDLAATRSLPPEHALARLRQLGRAAAGRLLALGGVRTPVGNIARIEGERDLPGGKVERVQSLAFWPLPSVLDALQADEAARKAATLYYQVRTSQIEGNPGAGGAQEH